MYSALLLSQRSEINRLGTIVCLLQAITSLTAMTLPINSKRKQLRVSWVTPLAAVCWIRDLANAASHYNS